MLAFARTGSVERREVDVAALVRSAAAHADADPVEIAFAPDAPASFSLDPERMEQVLVNLLRNARQAAGAAAPVEVEVSRAGAALRLVVRDSGPGFAPAEIERAFEPFYTTRAKGTGLGLSLARRVVELHGGKIRAVNRDAGGAQIAIEVPAELERS